MIFPNVYTDLGVGYDTLKHLNTIGLVFYTFPMMLNTFREYDSPVVALEYFGDRRRFLIYKGDTRTGKKYAINFGVVDLTKVGRELAGIAGAEPVEGFFDFLEAEWAKEGISRQLQTAGQR